MAKPHRIGISLPRGDDSQISRQGMDQGVTALSYLISGVLIWGLLGLLGDHLLGTHFLIPIGVVVGAGLGCYMIIARYGGLTNARADAKSGETKGETR